MYNVLLLLKSTTYLRRRRNSFTNQVSVYHKYRRLRTSVDGGHDRRLLIVPETRCVSDIDLRYPVRWITRPGIKGEDIFPDNFTKK